MAVRSDPVAAVRSGNSAALEAGLAQRARLLDAVLADVYGPQHLLADGALPPALVYANPAFLRPCRDGAADRPAELLQFYAADLMRAPDGTWHVLADRTGLADGLAHALQNRRRLGRVLPELFASQLLCHIDPFVDVCMDMMQRCRPDGRPRPGTAALLTPGHADPAWYGHVLLARELSCALVEGGDLTVRDGGLFLKTLRGLQPIGVLLRGVDGRSVDPLELEPDGVGVPGLLAAARDHVRIVNNPGSGLAEAPALAAFLPDLARRLLGEDLALPSVPTVWLGDGAARETVLREPDRLAASPGVRRCCRRRRVGDGRDKPARPARSGGRRTLALRGERGAHALGGALPRRRQAGAAPRRWSACSWSATEPAGGLCRAVSAACCRTERRHGPAPGRCSPRTSGFWPRILP